MAPPTQFVLRWMPFRSSRSKPTTTAPSPGGRRAPSSMPRLNQEAISFTEVCGNLFAMINWTPLTSLRIREAFRKENTARTNLEPRSEARFAGTKPFSSWTTKALASVRLSRRLTPFQRFLSGAVDTQIFRSYLPKAAHEPMFWVVPLRWARSSILPPREPSLAELRTRLQVSLLLARVGLAADSARRSG